jgi:hypothetical protein
MLRNGFVNVKDVRFGLGSHFASVGIEQDVFAFGLEKVAEFLLAGNC